MNQAERWIKCVCMATLILAWLAPACIAQSNEGMLRGTVIDKDGAALIGVTVMVIDGSKSQVAGTVSDMNGLFEIQGLQTGALYDIRFTYVGFQAKEELNFLVKKDDKNSLLIRMTEEVAGLDELVVVGYGTQKKRDLTGAVSQVSTTRLDNENPQTVQDILRGNIAGLNVGLSTSAKGGGSLLVRGTNSLNAGSTPLIVLDGAIYYGELSDVNPNDIETIDVLKDASSAAVFGAKAASGVILITTKKGKKGKPQININSNFGIAEPSRNEKVWGANEFLDWRGEVMKNINSSYKPYQFSNPANLPAEVSLNQWLAYDGSSGDATTVWLQRLGLQPIEIENYKAGKSVDWSRQIFQKGLRQDHTVSLSGKKDEFSYYMSLGYLSNEGILQGDMFKTVRGRLNLEGKINKFLTVGTNLQFSDRDESQVPVDWSLLQRLSPWGSEYDADGNYVFNPNGDANGGRHPHYDRSFIDRKKKYNTLNTTVFASVNLPLGINYRMNFTPRYEFYDYFNHNSSKHADWTAIGGTAQREHAKTLYWQVDNIFTWSKTINKVHQVDATFLVNAEKYQRWSDNMNAQGFLPSDVLGYHNIGTGILPVIASNDEVSTGDGLMARGFYSYKDRYMITLSARRDGYSAFGQKNPRAIFSSAALGWVFTDEKFVQIPWLNYGKLRLSWGSNGNRDIGRYVALSDLSTGKYIYQRQDGTAYQVNQLYVNRMQNNNLKWERTTSLNVGADFGIFGNKINGSLEVYKSFTTDLLVQRSLPDFLGFSYVWDNLGEVQNKGFEATINSVNINHDKFTWKTTATFQLNRNEIKHLYGDVDENGKEIDDIPNRWFIGHSIDEIWNYQVDGIWQTNEKEQAAKYGVRPGDFKIKDVDGDGKYTDADKDFQGWANPRFRWTLRNEVKVFNCLDIAVGIYSYWGHKSSFNRMKNRDGFLDRTTSYKLPYWTEENPNNEWARLYSSEGGASGFSVYRDRSFIRFDNISVGYTVPASLVRKANIEKLKFFGAVKNAGYYAPKWNFFDAEADGAAPRIYTLGIDITL